MTDIVVDIHLGWRDVAAVAEGARLHLGNLAKKRITEARAIVEAIVDRGIRAYGVNTGVGALCDVVVEFERAGKSVAVTRSTPRGSWPRSWPPTPPS